MLESCCCTQSWESEQTFPMKKEKIGALQALLTDFEFRQIAMFPSVLRLFYHGPLRYELENLVDSEEGKAKLKKLRFVEMHRVIDNKKIEQTR